CAAAQWVFPCSEEDARILHEEFAVPRERIEVVWNGTDSASIPFVTREARARHKAKLRVDVPLVLFMASGHQPNIDAAWQIFAMARALPGVGFVFVGHVAYAFMPSAVPQNVWLLGEVSDTARQIVLEAVDVAINPLRTGSGTSLKMLDYFAAGIPVVATPTGARGLPVLDGKHLLVRELGEFPQAIHWLIANREEASQLTVAARGLVEQQFDWRSIGERLLARVLEPEK
ncbi:MAG: glycosyltransferase family 4 protein, partial [Pseudomonadota bacterium]|nr:glycosyltransferase family 4 protein [Pseudomonadota bacterium]